MVSGPQQPDRGYFPGLIEQGNKQNGINTLPKIVVVTGAQQGDTVLDDPALLPTALDELRAKHSATVKRLGHDQG